MNRPSKFWLAYSEELDSRAGKGQSTARGFRMGRSLQQHDSELLLKMLRHSYCSSVIASYTIDRWKSAAIREEISSNPRTESDRSLCNSVRLSSTL